MLSRRTALLLLLPPPAGACIETAARRWDGAVPLLRTPPVNPPRAIEVQLASSSTAAGRPMTIREGLPSSVPPEISLQGPKTFLFFYLYIPVPRAQYLIT